MSSEPAKEFSDAQHMVGIAAVCVSVLINLPQLYKVVKSGKSKDLSCWTYILVCISSILWVTYHYLSGTYHGMVSASISLLTASIIIFFIFKQERECMRKISQKTKSR